MKIVYKYILSSSNPKNTAKLMWCEGGIQFYKSSVLKYLFTKIIHETSHCIHIFKHYSHKQEAPTMKPFSNRSCGFFKRTYD